MLAAISGSFERVDIPEVVRLLDKRFGEKTYSLRSLFRDEQRRILRTILSTTVAEAEAAYLQLYDHHAALMRFITSLGTPMPREFAAAVEYAINSLLRRACSAEELDGERIRSLLREAQASNVSLDKTTTEFLLRRKLDALAGRFAAENLWAAQNQVYSVQAGLYVRTKRRAQRGDPKAQEWVDAYLNLSELLMIRVPN